MKYIGTVGNKTNTGLEFVVDKITNSIENAITGDSFQTEVSILNRTDLKALSDKKLWVFDWKSEVKDPRKEVFKLTIIHNPNVIQGLISIEDKQNHVFMHLLESAVFNKGKDKVYLGVPGNLVAFACKKAFQLGYEGNIAFISKSKLIEHYENALGAIHIGGRTMIIHQSAALKLINKYFPNG